MGRFKYYSLGRSLPFHLQGKGSADFARNCEYREQWPEYFGMRTGRLAVVKMRQLQLQLHIMTARIFGRTRVIQNSSRPSPFGRDYSQSSAFNTTRRFWSLDPLTA